MANRQLRVPGNPDPVVVGWVLDGENVEKLGALRTDAELDEAFAGKASATQGALADTALQPEDIGTTAGALVALDAEARLPAVDASQLLNLPGGGGGGGFFTFDDPTRTLTVTEGQPGGPVFDDATRTLTF